MRSNCGQNTNTMSKRKSTRVQHNQQKKQNSTPTFQNPFGSKALKYAQEHNALSVSEAKKKWPDIKWKGEVIVLTNGDVYCGEWKDDKFHGRGKYLNVAGRNEGMLYEGEFSAGMCDGPGKSFWLPSSKIWTENAHIQVISCAPYKGLPFNYEGEFKADMRHGLGTVTFQNGERFHGLWKKHKPYKFNNHDRIRMNGGEGETKEEQLDNNTEPSQPVPTPAPTAVVNKLSARIMKSFDDVMDVNTILNVQTMKPLDLLCLLEQKLFGETDPKGLKGILKRILHYEEALKKF